MKKLIILLAFITSGLWGQPILSVPVPPVLTVSQMAAIPVPAINARITVSNGTNGSDCTVGGGTTYVDCKYNGAIWTAATGASTFDALGAGTNTTSAMRVGSNSSLAPLGTGTVTSNRLVNSALAALTVNGCVAIAADGSIGYLASFACDVASGIMSVGTSASLVPVSTGQVWANRIIPGGGTSSSGDGVLKSTSSVPDVITGTSTNCVLVSASSTTCGLAPIVIASTGSAASPVFTCPTNSTYIIFTHTLSANATPTFSCANGTPFKVKWTQNGTGNWTVTFGVTWLRGHQPLATAAATTIEGFVVNNSIAESDGSYITSYAGAPVIVSDATGFTHTFPDTQNDTVMNLQDAQTVTGQKTFVAPILGAATATTVNKLTITTPASSATLTVANGKTATISNTLTFTGTDSSSVAFGAGGTAAYTIASGTKALATSAISSAACTAAQTSSATGTLTTDIVTASFNGDPTAVTGYVPLTTGMLTVIIYPTADNVNFKVCNNTSSSITPGAITLNWRVTR